MTVAPAARRPSGWPWSARVLAILMFRLTRPSAAVFELSVCAGLIPVIFISAISLTQRLKRDEAKARAP